MSLDTIRKAQRWCLDRIVKNCPGIGLDRRAEQVVALFDEYIPHASRVLDIGGGWGFYVDPLKRARNCDVTVLDVVEPEFRKAPVVTYEGERIPFPDGSFDISLLITMLHHVESPEKVLSEAKRVTRRFVIVVEDLYRHWAGRLWTVLRDSIYNFEYVGHPQNFRNRKQWVQSFRQLGFGLHAEKEVYTSLLGMRILNGVFVLNTHDNGN